MGVSGVLEHGGKMSPPSLKRHSASAHFADKKGIQLSPSIYLARSALHLPLSPILPLLRPPFFSKVLEKVPLPSLLLRRRKRFLAIQCFLNQPLQPLQIKKIITWGAKTTILWYLVFSFLCTTRMVKNWKPHPKKPILMTIHK